VTRKNCLKFCPIFVKKVAQKIPKYIHQSWIWKPITSTSNHCWNLKTPTTNNVLKLLVQVKIGSVKSSLNGEFCSIWLHYPELSKFATGHYFFNLLCQMNNLSVPSDKMASWQNNQAPNILRLRNCYKLHSSKSIFPLAKFSTIMPVTDTTVLAFATLGNVTPQIEMILSVLHHPRCPIQVVVANILKNKALPIYMSLYWIVYIYKVS